MIIEFKAVIMTWAIDELHGVNANITRESAARNMLNINQCRK